MSSAIRLFIEENGLSLLVDPDDRLKMISQLSGQSDYNKWPVEKVLEAIDTIGLQITNEYRQILQNLNIVTFPQDTKPLLKFSEDELTKFITELFQFTEVKISLDLDTSKMKVEMEDFPILDIKDIAPTEVTVLFGNTAFGLTPISNFFNPKEPALTAIQNSYQTTIANLERRYNDLEYLANLKINALLASSNSLPPFWGAHIQDDSRISFRYQTNTEWVISIIYKNCKLKTVVNEQGTIYKLRQSIEHPPFIVSISIRKSDNIPENVYATRCDSNNKYVSFHSSNYICMGNAVFSPIQTDTDLIELAKLIESVFETANFIGMFGSLSESNQIDLYRALWQGGRLVVDNRYLFPRNDQDSATIDFDITEETSDDDYEEEEQENDDDRY